MAVEKDNALESRPPPTEKAASSLPGQEKQDQDQEISGRTGSIRGPNKERGNTIQELHA